MEYWKYCQMTRIDRVRYSEVSRKTLVEEDILDFIEMV